MITKVKRLHDSAVLPQYGYPGDAGMDLAVVGQHILNPGESRDLPTGIAVELPKGHWARITGRSSTLRKRGLFINEGVIDEGYRGELLVYVTNRQSTAVSIADGDRLAQLIVHPVAQAPAEWADELTDSHRGTNGFGSTGTGGGIATDVSRVVPTAVVPRVRRGPVYLGGAVDIGDRDLNHNWRHSDWPVAIYCPMCACADLVAPVDIIERNTKALDLATDAVFLLDAFTVGTPIEAWHRIVRRALPAVIVLPEGRQSVFVDYMAGFPGVEVVRHLHQARGLVAARATPSLAPTSGG